MRGGEKGNLRNVCPECPPTQRHKEIHLRTGSDILECHRRWENGEKAGKCEMEKEKGHSTGNKRNTYALSVTKISFDSGEKG